MLMSRKNKLLNIVFIVAIIIVNIILIPKLVNADVVVWDGTIASHFDGGTGTEDNPYQISNASQLALLAKLVNENNISYNSADYILTADIYLNDTTDWKNWIKKKPQNIWQPIGIHHYFAGSFDGNGYIIRGMYISGIMYVDEEDVNYDEANGAGTGLFGYVSEGTIRNLGIEESCLIDKNYNQGGIAGNLNSGMIINCHYDGIIRATEGSHTGGIVGVNWGTVKDCYNYGSVELTRTQGYAGDIGGIAGLNYGMIENCYNQGNIIMGKDTNNDIIGGVVGVNEGKISKCSNKGKIQTFSISECGGIVGACNDGKIIDSYNVGEIVSGKKSKIVGGIVGELHNSETRNCYNTGKLTIGDDSYYIGGIAGILYKSNIINCHNNGKIEVKGEGYYVGGLVGRTLYYNKSNTITSSYNKGNIMCKNKGQSVGGIAGRFEGSIKKCSNSASINTGDDSNCIGGILGETTKGKVYNCFNSGKVVTVNGSFIGGIVGELGVFAIIGDEYPNLKPGLYNCYNTGTIGGKGCFYVGGIVGESYSKSYNSYNVGKIKGSSCVGGIIGRVTLGNNNIPQACYYLKGCTQLYPSDFKEEPTNEGKEMTKKQMKSSSFIKILNKWASKDNKKYNSWKISTKENNGYPYLKLDE